MFRINSVAVVKGITDAIDEIDNKNFGAPSVAPVPTVKEVGDKNNAINDIAGSMLDANSNTMCP